MTEERILLEFHTPRTVTKVAWDGIDLVVTYDNRDWDCGADVIYIPKEYLPKLLAALQSVMEEA